MSSPHAAGAATLVRAVQPSWTPAEVKSALMMTAFTGGTKENGTTPWDADDVGHGRLDLTRAARAGMVMNETTANSFAANPGSGGRRPDAQPPVAAQFELARPPSWTRHGAQHADGRPHLDRDRIAGTPARITVSPDTFSFTGDPNETRDGDLQAKRSGRTSPLRSPSARVVFSEAGASRPTCASPSRCAALARWPLFSNGSRRAT